MTAVGRIVFNPFPWIGGILLIAIIAMTFGQVSSTPPLDPGDFEDKTCKLIDTSLDLTLYHFDTIYQGTELVGLTVSSIAEVAPGFSEVSAVFTLQKVSPNLGPQLQVLAEKGIFVEEAWTAAAVNAGEEGVGEATKILRAGDQRLKDLSPNHWRQLSSRGGDWTTYQSCFNSRAVRPFDGFSSGFLGKIK